MSELQQSYTYKPQIEKFQKLRWAKLCRSRTKLHKRLVCQKCRRSFNNFRATSYHYFVSHSDGITKKSEPTLRECLEDLEKQYKKIFGGSK